MQNNAEKAYAKQRRKNLCRRKAAHVVGEAIGRVVGNAHGFCLAVKRHDAQHWAEYFLLLNCHSGFNVCENGWANVIALGYA